MMFNFRQAMVAGLAVSLISLTSLAAADDWVATKLRGTVLQFVDQQWQPLKRGDIVPDSRFVRTAPNGMVELTRGAETVSLDPNSQVRIFDKGGVKPYTTVKQDFGIVSVEAEVRDVQHFAVVTPFLAAVVKGTRFVVASGRSTAWVKVRRGHVLVEDAHEHTHVMLEVGQHAAMDMRKGPGMVVAGIGPLAAIVDAHGDAVVSDDGSSESSGKGKSATAGSNGNGHSGEGNSGNSGNSNSGNSNSGNSNSGKGNSGNGNSGNGNSGNGNSGNGNSGNGNSGNGNSGNGNGGDGEDD